MVSIVIPYFKREELLKKNLENYRRLYPNLQMEFIVVNDGDTPPNVDATVINLPTKEEPLNPCVPINIGVRAAKYDICCITGPEIFHREPILYELADMAYQHSRSWVTAAVWGHINRRWHCHTSVNKEKHHVEGISEHAGFHFMAAFHRSYFLGFGGMDENYRFGRDYDDNDLICTLDKNDAVFTCLDHLVCDHRVTPKLRWKVGSNRHLFKDKWKGIYDFKFPV